MSDIEGGCACGKVRFKITAPLMGVAVCHCTDCQKSTGGPPNYVALAATSAFEVTVGQPKKYTLTAASGTDISRTFCADCGTPLWAEPTGGPFIPVKLGALDDSSALTPSLHLYTDSAQPWHLMHEGLPRFPKMPPGPPPG